MIRSASPGSARPGGTFSSATSGSARSGSRSSKLAMRPSSGTAILIALGLAGRCASAARDTESSAGSREAAREEGHDAEARQVAAAGDDRETAVEEPDIAAELVDDIALEAAALALFEQHHRAQDAGDDAAPVDIADEHHWQIGGLGEAHIGDIAGAQIGLRRAAGPLHQHEIGPLAHGVEALERAWAGRSSSGIARRRPWHCPRPCPGSRPARRSRSAASAARDSYAPRARRRRRAPAAPGPGRSPRHPPSPPHCWTCSAA